MGLGEQEVRAERLPYPYAPRMPHGAANAIKDTLRRL
jgi:hypothetical protein